jgi:hypothetical protein
LGESFGGHSLSNHPVYGEAAGVTEALATLALALFALAGAVLWYAHRREVASRQQAAKSFHSDISHVTMLLNTMREILQQQKDLARQFNENLERKSSAMRQLAGLAMENLEKLRETRRQVFEELEEARAELAALHQQAEYLRERNERSIALAESAAKVPELTPEEPLAPPKAKAAKPRASGGRKSGGAKKAADAPPAAAPAETPNPDWMPAPPAPPTAEAETAVDDHSDLPVEYTESSREALRSLLGLDKTDLTPPREKFTPVELASGAASNGKSFPAALRSRVEEYHNAGMSVGEIARELGLGKGEVRLILSMGKDR